MRPIGLLAGGAVALMGLAVAGHVRAGNLDKSAGSVTAVTGKVTATRLEAASRPLRFRDPVFWRDVVEAREDSIARVLLAGKTTVTIRELSRLELRQEMLTTGIRYAAELISGKMRASVARMLMQPGEQVQIRTRNAVASVRGTDFIVETWDRPVPGGPFGLLGVREIVQAVGDGGRIDQTVVITLSGVVEVFNRLAAPGRSELVGPFQAVLVSGRADPVPFAVSGRDLRLYLHGLTPPRPQEARSGDRAESVGTRVEQAALARSTVTVKLLEQAGGDGGGSKPVRPDDRDEQNHRQSSASRPAGDARPPGQAPSAPAASTAVTPVAARAPAAPATPATPAAPATPASAATPATPAAAATRATPAVPATPAAPATPATPAAPATPASAATPATPAAAAARATPAAVPASPAAVAAPAAPAAPLAATAATPPGGGNPGGGKKK